MARSVMDLICATVHKNIGTAMPRHLWLANALDPTLYWAYTSASMFPFHRFLARNEDCQNIDFFDDWRPIRKSDLGKTVL